MPTAGPFLSDQKGAKESVREGDGVAASCASLASPLGNSRTLRCGSFPIRTRFAGLRTGPLLPPSQHPSPLNDQAQGEGDPNGAQRSGSIWERRSKGADRIFAARRKWRGADFATTIVPPIGSTPRALLQPRLLAPAAYVVTPPVQGAQVRRRKGGTLGPTAEHFRRIRPYRLPFRGVTHPRPHGPKTRRLRDRTTAFPCSSHGWPWPGGVLVRCVKHLAAVPFVPTLR